MNLRHNGCYAYYLYHIYSTHRKTSLFFTFSTLSYLQKVLSPDICNEKALLVKPLENNKKFYIKILK